MKISRRWWTNCWRRPALRASRLILALGLGLGLLGCGGERPEAARVLLTVHVPCVISGPMNKAVAAYGASHPEVEIGVEVDKPLAVLLAAGEDGEGAAAIVTMGDVEMRWLAGQGAVEASDVRTIGIIPYPLVVVASAEGAPGGDELADLAGPAVKRIFVEDPARSSLGDRTEHALEQLGIWDEVAPKIVRPDANAMVLGELIAGKADAAVVYKGCLFAETGSEPNVPKTIRVIGEIPEEAYAPIPYQGAVLRGAGRAGVARDFVDFLAGPEGKRVLEEAGLRRS